MESPRVTSCDPPVGTCVTTNAFRLAAHPQETDHDRHVPARGDAGGPTLAADGVRLCGGLTLMQPRPRQDRPSREPLVRAASIRGAEANLRPLTPRQGRARTPCCRPPGHPRGVGPPHRRPSLRLARPYTSRSQACRHRGAHDLAGKQDSINDRDYGSQSRGYRLPLGSV